MAKRKEAKRRDPYLKKLSKARSNDWVGTKSIPEKKKGRPMFYDPKSTPTDTMTQAELKKARLRASSLVDAQPPTLSKWTPTEQYSHRLCPDCGYGDGRHSSLCRGSNA